MMRKDLLPIAKAMGPICPSVLEQLKSNWDDSLSAYIQQVWQKPISCSSTLALQARSCFYETLKLFLAKKSVDFKNLFLEFDRFPILQTGPHCQLYTNDVDFNAMLMSWMGSQVHQLKHCLILNSITRTLQWSKRQGPGWLTLKQDVVNVFNLSPKKMSRLSVCSLYPGLSYCFDNFNNYITQQIVFGLMADRQFAEFRLILEFVA